MTRTGGFLDFQYLCEANQASGAWEGSVMVWGINNASSFGQFWPNGVPEANANGQDGWHDRLVAHYLAQPREEQRRLFDYGDKVNATLYAVHAKGKFNYEPGSVSLMDPDDPPYGPIEPHEVPRSYEIMPIRALGSLIQLSLLGIAVAGDLKAIIERLEPGVHQFFPIPIRVMPKRVDFPKDYYVLVIGQYLDSFLPEENHRPSLDRSGYMFSKSAFDGAHLWRERKLHQALICFSDQLHDEIIKAELRMPKFYKMKEV